jgi:hypothetical protein
MDINSQMWKQKSRYPLKLWLAAKSFSCLKPNMIINRPVVALTLKFFLKELRYTLLYWFIIIFLHQSIIFLTTQDFIRHYICAKIIIISIKLSEYPFRWLHNLRILPIFEWEDKSARIMDPLLCLLYCEGLIRYLLNLAAYISACVYVCLLGGGGGVKERHKGA